MKVYWKKVHHCVQYTHQRSQEQKHGHNSFEDATVEFIASKEYTCTEDFSSIHLTYGYLDMMKNTTGIRNYSCMENLPTRLHFNIGYRIMLNIGDNVSDRIKHKVDN